MLVPLQSPNNITAKTATPIFVQRPIIETTQHNHHDAGSTCGGESYLEALDKSRFLAADVGARPSVQVNVEVVTGPAGVLAKESFLRGSKNEKEGEP